MFPKKFWKSNKQDETTEIDILINRANRRNMPRKLSAERVEHLLDTLEHRKETTRRRNEMAKKSRSKNVHK
jgi:hypothetical protein